MLFSVCLLDGLVLDFCYSNLSLETGGIELTLTITLITSEPTNEVHSTPPKFTYAEELFKGIFHVSFSEHDLEERSLIM